MLKSEYNITVFAYQYTLNKSNPTKDDSLIYVIDNTLILDSFEEYCWLRSIDTFFQINHQQAKVMYKIIRDIVFALDQPINYLGIGGDVGLFGYMFRNYYSRMIGLSNSENIIKDANINYVFHQLNNELIYCDYATVNLDVLSLDNWFVTINIGRQPVEHHLMNQLLGNDNIKRIIYIGCNYASVSKDASILRENFYINNIFKINMFPQTEYFEYVVDLIRN
jgi:23S rRNA (uracil1939-C5)-methyltransferase